MDANELRKLPKEAIAVSSKKLTEADVGFLVEALKEKDDKLRYNAFLLLQATSRQSSVVYPYWMELEKKLDSDNSYQRSLGVMLLAENVRWDSEGKFGGVLKKFFICCLDEKFITARQTIRALGTVVKTTDKYNAQIKEALRTLAFSGYPANQQKLLVKDVAAVLESVEKQQIK